MEPNSPDVACEVEQLMIPTLLQGNIHRDVRGEIRFVNAFDMKSVVRMYTIVPAMGVIRAWQGHRIEAKWFSVLYGEVEVSIIPVLGWEVPFEVGVPYNYALSSANPQVLHIPGGYLNGFRSLKPNSILQVYSDVSLEVSSEDDYRATLDDIPWPTPL